MTVVIRIYSNLPFFRYYYPDVSDIWCVPSECIYTRGTNHGPPYSETSDTLYRRAQIYRDLWFARGTAAFTFIVYFYRELPCQCLFSIWVAAVTPSNDWTSRIVCYDREIVISFPAIMREKSLRVYVQVGFLPKGIFSRHKLAHYVEMFQSIL